MPIKTLTPPLRFPEFQEMGKWESSFGNELFSVINNRNHNSDLPILAITQEQGAIPRDKINYHVSVSMESIKSYKVVELEDFIISLRSFQGGIEYSTYKGLCSPAYIILRNQKEISNSYFKYLFKTESFISALNKNLEGLRDGKMISYKQFSEIKIPFPTLKNEQQKIAGCLTAVNDLIIAESAQLDALKEHKQGLMQNLFPAEGEATPELRFPEFTGEWETKPLQSVADYENGKAYEPHIVENGKYVVVNSRFISTEGQIKKFSNEQLCIANYGDVLMVLSDLPNGRALAKCFFVDADERYAVNQRICRLIPHDIVSRFFFYLLNRHPELLAYDDGMGQTHLKKNSVLECSLQIPSNPSEQQKIANCLTAMDDLIDAQQQKITALHNHKKGLMQQLFPNLEDDA